VSKVTISPAGGDRDGTRVTNASEEMESLEVELLNVALPEREVARWTLPLSCGYSSVHALLAKRVHALRQNSRPEIQSAC